jgi:hypothetical protein
VSKKLSAFVSIKNTTNEPSEARHLIPYPGGYSLVYRLLNMTRIPRTQYCKGNRHKWHSHAPRRHEI